MRFLRVRRAAWLILLASLHCASSRAGGAGALEPRFVALHNALSAMGLALIGPIEQGSLAEGKETRISMSLPAGCVTIVAVGGEGVRDLDATLVDVHDKPLAHDTTNEPQAVLRACLEASDTYSLIVKAASGGGPWVVGAWAGGIGAGPGAPATTTGLPVQEANGTCAAPIPLSPGTVAGSTTWGKHEYSASCSQSESGRELVYELDVSQRQRITIEVDAMFDSVLYVRKGDCTDDSAEVACNDDASDQRHSKVEEVFEPGKYFVFVDGYDKDSGKFKMTVTTTPVVALSEACRGAPTLADGTPRAGSTLHMADDAEATCGGGALGADAAWALDLPSRSRVRIVEHSEDMPPVVHVRRSCLAAQSELACGESGAAPGDAVVTGVFEPGSYAVFADARPRGATGRYTLLLQTTPPAGSGTSPDSCGDAAPLSGSSGVVEGDTFAARDDVAGSCGGAGAADVIYRFDATRRSRFTASLNNEEAPHVLVLWRRCADRSTEVACGRGLSEVIEPGTYFVAVDGASADAFGRFALRWALQDLTPQSSACSTAPLLVPGRTISSSTSGAGDRFASRCVAGDTGAGGPDRVFKVVVARRATLRVTVTAPTFDAAIALRKACGETVDGLPAEIACESDSDSNHRTTLERALEPGTYWIVVDGQSANDQGPFAIDARLLAASVAK
jgi:hypothetical protein